MRWARLLTASLLPLAAPACDAAGRGALPAIVRDSAGVRIVENPAGAPGLGWIIAADPQLDVGGASTGSDLFEVRGARRLRGGRLVVANGGSRELRFYDASGSFLHASGREGEGPGEFRSIWFFGPAPGDSLMVFDVATRRVSVLDREGSFGRSFPLQSTEAVAFGAVSGILDDGTMVARGLTRSDGVTPTGFARFPNPYHLYRWDGSVGPALGAVPGAETFFAQGEGSVRAREPFFPRHTIMTGGGDRVIQATTDTWEIRLHDRDGLLRTIVRRASMPRRVTAAHLRAERERRLAGADPEELDNVRLLLAALPEPETFPSFSAVQRDDLGYLWVSDYRVPGEEAVTWTVLDREGRMMGSLAGPAGFEPLQIGEDFMVGRWRDSLDVEHVRIHALERAQP